MLNTLLTKAINNRASDIHIEMFRDHCIIRTRTDGLLYKQTKCSLEQGRQLISQLKIQADLDIAEKLLPQDGRFIFTFETHKKRHCRISTCPCIHGEKLVIRLLDNHQSILDIKQLGMLSHQQTLLIEKINKTQGLVIITGPTGSGKTITIYSALSIINTIHRNITTIEDPVEIELNGINQVNINKAVGFDFCNALKTFLRQDPDVIVVGEIRDTETAKMAIRAAQTGHLVLATMHANNAIDTIQRLNHLGISTFDAVNTISLIIAQRLVRKLCTHCKKTMDPNNPLLKMDPLKLIELNVQYVEANDCEQCHAGYSGRTGIFETMNLTPEISTLLIQRSTNTYNHLTIDNKHYTPLTHVAKKLLQQGITSYEELQRHI